MNALIFCVAFSFCTSQALLYMDIGELLASGVIDTEIDLDCRPYEFTYRKGDYFVLWIKSYKRINSTTLMPIPADAIVKMQLGMWYRQYISREKTYTNIQFYLDQDTITVDVQVTTGKVCEEITVLKGIRLPEGVNVTASKYDNICIGGRNCAIDVHQSAVCEDKKKGRTRPCTSYERALPSSSYAPEDEDLGVKNTQTAARNLSDCLTSTNNSTTSRASDNSKDGADNTYFTIMIIALVTAAIAVILLLIITIKQQCWVRYNPSGMIHISPINDNRYYENVVFRTEIDPRVDQQEQLIYDEPSAEI